MEVGNENIRKYYQQLKTGDVTLTWAPDFIEISDDATLAYTYGKFVWKSKTIDEQTKVSTGVFHTIWKKQKNGSWKYVWD
jgi:ketosteroid isomerase-like protein